MAEAAADADRYFESLGPEELEHLRELKRLGREVDE